MVGGWEIVILISDQLIDQKQPFKIMGIAIGLILKMMTIKLCTFD
jgi:hypothetical protein